MQRGNGNKETHSNQRGHEIDHNPILSIPSYLRICIIAHKIRLLIDNWINTLNTELSTDCEVVSTRNTISIPIRAASDSSLSEMVKLPKLYYYTSYTCA